MYDNPWMVSRVFNARLTELLDNLNEIFDNKVTAVIASVEFQLRGLPHAHLILSLSDPINTPEGVEKFVKATLKGLSPEEQLDTIRWMLHTCSDEKCGNCRKRFPFPKGETEIFTSAGGFQAVQYGRYCKKDQYLVPFCPAVLKAWGGHANMLIVLSGSVVVYLFKYVLKLRDHTGRLGDIKDETGALDEVFQFQNCRAVTTSEACWDLGGWKKYWIHPRVKCLPVVTKGIIIAAEDEGNDETDDERDWQSDDDVESETLAWNVQIYLSRPECEELDLTYVQFAERYRIDNTSDGTPRGKPCFSWLLGGRPIYCHRRSTTEIVRLNYLPRRHPYFYARLRLYSEVVYGGLSKATTMKELENIDEALAFFRDVTHLDGYTYRKVFAEYFTIGKTAVLKEIFTQYQEKILESLPTRTAIKELKLFLMREGITVSVIEEVICGEDMITVEEQKTVLTDMTTLQMAALESERLCNEARLQFHTEQTDAFAKLAYHPWGLWLFSALAGSGKSYVIQALQYHWASKGEKGVIMASSNQATKVYKVANTVHFILNANIEGVAQLTEAHIHLLREASTFVIDEVFMLEKNILELFERVLRDVCNSVQPFGGKRVILVGSEHQFSCVAKREAHSHMGFFSPAERSAAYRKSVLTSPLLRQFKLVTMENLIRYGGDEEFGNFNKQIAMGEVKEVDLSQFPRALTAQISHDVKRGDIKCACVCLTHQTARETHNTIIDSFPEEDTHTLKAEIDHPEGEIVLGLLAEEEFGNDGEVPDVFLKVAKGCKMKLIRSYGQHPKNTELKITGVHDHYLHCVVVGKSEVLYLPRVRFAKEGRVSGVEGYVIQYPLYSGYVHTAHAVQGSTFDRIFICGDESPWSHGSTHVIFSRVRSRAGIFIFGRNIRSKMANVVWGEFLLNPDDFQSD